MSPDLVLELAAAVSVFVVVIGALLVVGTRDPERPRAQPPPARRPPGGAGA